MTARLVYVKCPHCPEIRNAYGLTMHIRRAHAAKVAA